MRTSPFGGGLSRPVDIATVIGAQTAVRGRLDGDEDVRVLGRFEGAVRLGATFVVAVGGYVEAEIEAREVVIAGTVVGNVTAEECVRLERGARLVGDIRSPRVVLAEGAAVRGAIDMGEVAAQPVEARRAASGSSSVGYSTAGARSAARPATAGSASMVSAGATARTATTTGFGGATARTATTTGTTPARATGLAAAAAASKTASARRDEDSTVVLPASKAESTAKKTPKKAPVRRMPQRGRHSGKGRG